MKEFIKATDIEGYQVRYYLTKNGTVYGIYCSLYQGESFLSKNHSEHVSPDRFLTLSLIEKLAEHAVFPANLTDVLEDWHYEQIQNFCR